MPLALLSDRELTILEALSPSSLRSLVATNRQLRRHVHDFVTRLQIGWWQDVLLLACQDWPSLTALNLSRANLDSSSIYVLTRAPLHGLQHLNLSQNQLNVQAMQTLVQGSWPQLQQLDLCACVPDDRLCCSCHWNADAIREYPKGERLFSYLATGKWPKLAVLNVSGNEGLGIGMADLVKGPWPALTSLDMTDSFRQASIFDSMIDVSAAVVPALASLSLGTDRVWEQRPACLRISSHELSHLTELDLHGTDLLEYSTGPSWGSCLVQGDWQMLGHLNLKNTSNAGAVLAQGKWPQLVYLQLDSECTGKLVRLDRANLSALRSLEFSNQALGYEHARLVYGVQVLLNKFAGSLDTLVVSGMTVAHPAPTPYLSHSWPPNTALGLVVKAHAAVLESLCFWPVTSVKLDPPCESMRLCGLCLGRLVAALIKCSFVMLQHLDLSSLNHMDLRVSFIGDIASGHWPALMSLCLDGNRLNDASLAPLTNGDWPVLTFLSLRDNQLSEEAVRSLVRGNWPLLRTLQLFGNDFYPSSTINGLEASACFEQLFPEVSSHLHAKWPTISLPSYQYFAL